MAGVRSTALSLDGAMERNEPENVLRAVLLALNGVKGPTRAQGPDADRRLACVSAVIPVTSELYGIQAHFLTHFPRS